MNIGKLIVRTADVLISKSTWLAIGLLAVLAIHLASAQAAVKLHGFRMVQQDNVMLHFDLDSNAATVDMFSLEKPQRLVIDLPGATLATQLPSETFPQGVVQSIRYAQHGDDYLRVVLDLRHDVSATYQIVPRQGGQRLVVDLGVKATPNNGIAQHRAIPKRDLRDVIVAIDAGHGGKDPGAIGQRKTQEKDITLAIAIKLKALLDKREGISAVLIRDSDVYIKLRQRILRARELQADLFVSIHADAVTRRDARGSSVYALSMDGASSEAAALLAKSENESAALFGEVTLDGMDDSLRHILLNLAQNNTMELSMEAGADVLAQLKKIGAVHKPTVEQAAFAVLKSPDIPSVLVETAFLSNPQEEKKLNSRSFQNKLAAALDVGLTHFLEKRAPDSTFLAARRSGGGS
ncbi:MAG: N-acetylmuramoyl-L-alanine amidase [Granulosicoccus sp.]